MGKVPQQKQVMPVIPGAFEMEGKEPHLIGTKCSKCGAAFPAEADMYVLPYG
jgi:uncharacterized OB-fold protein